MVEGVQQGPVLVGTFFKGRLGAFFRFSQHSHTKPRATDRRREASSSGYARAKCSTR